MKWLIVEDALRDRKGHWLEYVSTFVRELRALGDVVVVLCDHKAQGFIMEQTGARPVLPESIWHRMGDGAGALKRYPRVPGHAIATFFAMRKVFRGFNHNRARGQVQERATGGWPEGRGSGNERVKGHREHRGESAKKQEINHENHEKARIDKAGQRLDKPSCAAFSSPSTSELARDSENTSLTRSASGPASALDAGRSSLDSGEAPDWIFVPTVLVHHLLGWWMLLKTRLVSQGSRVLLFFPNLPIRLDDQGQPHWTGGPTTKLMAWLFENLRAEVENGKVVLGVETHAMRRALEGLIRMPVVYLPHPVVAAQPPMTDGGGRRTEEKFEEFVHKSSGGEGSGSTRPEGEISCAGAKPELPVCEQGRGARPSSLDSRPESPATSHPLPATSAKPIVFGCYGAARWEKGSDIFQEAIRLILKNEVASAECRVASARNQSAAGLSEPVTNYSLPATAAGRPLRFCIQWVEDFRDGEGNLISIDPWLREHPQVEVIGRYFKGDEYEQRLAQTDVMVLPYRQPYQLRVSRVVIEAMLNGMPVIATKGTTLFEQSEEYGMVIGCDEGDAVNLAEAILEVAESFESLQTSAAEKMNAAVESFSVACFRKIVMKTCYERK